MNNTILFILLVVFSNAVGARDQCVYSKVIEWPKYEVHLQEVSLDKNYKPEWSDPGQLAGPTSIAVDTQKNVYVSDPVNRRIIVFNDSDKSIKTINIQGPKKDKMLLFNVGINSKGIIIVANKSTKQIQKYDKSGRLLQQFPWDPFYPAAIETTKDGRIFLLRPNSTKPLDQFDSRNNPIYPATINYQKQNTDQHRGFTVKVRGYGKLSKLEVLKDGSSLLKCSNLNLEDQVPPVITEDGYLYYMIFSLKDMKRFNISRIKIPK